MSLQFDIGSLSEPLDRGALVIGDALRRAASGLDAADESIRTMADAQPDISFLEFIAGAWHVIEPQTQFLSNWHIEAKADHLTAVVFGDIRNLVINEPPRCMKSLTVSVFLMCWVWTFRPWTRWLHASYGQELSNRDSDKCRLIISSNWYQRNWGDKFKLTRDAVTKFENNHSGFRLATSPEGRGTGEGGHFRVCDDVHNVNKAESAADRRSKREWFDRTWSNRYVTGPTDPQILCMHRVHEADVAARAIELGWTHLCLPYEFEPKRRCVTVPLNGSDEPWQDPRTEPGELIWPERFKGETVEETKRNMGSYAYAGQMQQNPTPGEGGTWKRHWWRYWVPRGVTMPPVEVELPNGKTMLIEPVELTFKLNEPPNTLHSWDMTFQKTTDGSYVVGQVWVTRESHRFLVDQIRERMEFTEAQAAVVKLDAKWPGGKKLVEKKANGAAIINSLDGVVSRLIPEEPEGSKEARAAAVSPDIEAGDVFLPHPDLPGYEWVDDFIEECAAFPLGSHDDQVDAASQALKHLQQTAIPMGIAPLSTGSSVNAYRWQ